MSWKVSPMIISMLVIALLLTLFGNFLASMNDNYTAEDEYNSSDMAVYNKLSELTNNTEEIRDKVDDIETESGVLDKIGAYFDSAYDAFQLTKNSADTMTLIVNEGVEDANLGVNAEATRTVIVTILIVIIIVGVVISVLLKRDV